MARAREARHRLRLARFRPDRVPVRLAPGVARDRDLLLQRRDIPALLRVGRGLAADRLLSDRHLERRRREREAERRQIPAGVDVDVKTNPKMSDLERDFAQTSRSRVEMNTGPRISPNHRNLSEIGGFKDKI